MRLLAMTSFSQLLTVSVSLPWHIIWYIRKLVNIILKHVQWSAVLWRCWLGGRKGIRPVKNLKWWVLAWLSVRSEVQTCIWPSWCHCYSLSLASVKSRLVYNGVCVCTVVSKHWIWAIFLMVGSISVVCWFMGWMLLLTVRVYCGLFAFSALTLLVGRQEWWGAGMVICLARGADLHMSQLMPLPLTVFCFSKSQIGFTFLVPAHPGSPEKRAVKRVCVCVCIVICCSCTLLCVFCHTRAWMNALQCLVSRSQWIICMFVISAVRCENSNSYHGVVICCAWLNGTCTTNS